jgi:hypothetical protein
MLQLAMLAAAILVAAYFGMSFVANQGRQSTLRRQNSKYQGFIDHLKGQFNDAMICTGALGGQTLNLTLNTWSDVSLNIGYGADPGPIGAGWKGKESGYAMRKVQLMVQKRAQTTDAGGSSLDRNVIYDFPQQGPTTNSFQKYFGALRIIPDDSLWNTENQDGWVKLSFVVNAPGQIHACFGQFSVAEACEANGGAYDPTGGSSAAQRCNPDVFCVNHSEGLVTDPNVCQYPYVANSMGYFNGSLQYLCTWCNRNH